MKQLLLTLGLFLGLSMSLSAQDVIWSEDFGDGLRGWTVNTSLCEAFQGGQYGTWQLTSATISGTPIDISELNFKWSFMTSAVYTA
ncbi:MAG: hypothetical protein D6772_00510, partial [Bacteroidetes bacterium]